MEPMSDIRSYRKRSSSKEPSSVCRARTSHIGRVAFGEDYSGQRQSQLVKEQKAAAANLKKEVGQMSFRFRDPFARETFRSQIALYAEAVSETTKIRRLHSIRVVPRTRSVFQNCVAFNKWNKAEQLAFLRQLWIRRQVLWDYNQTEVNSAAKLIRKLRHRFGGTSQPEKYRMEAKCRRRKPGESLQHLHSDIRCLTALAFPKLATLICAYKEALNVEMWQQSVKEQSTSGRRPSQDRAHRSDTTKKRKIRTNFLARN